MSTSKKILSATLYPICRTRDKHWFVKVRYVTGHTRKLCGRMNSFPEINDRLKEAKRIMRGLRYAGERQRRQELKLIENLSAVVERRRPGLEEKSYQGYISMLKKFAEWYRPAHKKNRNVKPEDFMQFLFENAHSQTYIIKFGVVLRSFFKDLVKARKYPSNPFSDYQRKKIKGESKLPFTEKQIKILSPLLKEKSKQLWFSTRFLYYMFTRPGKEMRLLKIGDILIDDGKITIRGRNAKNDNTQLISIPDPFIKKLRKWIKGYPADYYLFTTAGMPGPQPAGINYLSDKHREVITPLKWGKRYTFYSWVHTGIKRAAMAGIPLKQLQIQKRHKSLDMFNEYMKDLGVDDCRELKMKFPSI